MRTKGVGPHGLGVSPLKQTDYEKALNQKHSVKTKTSSQGDNNSIKRIVSTNLNEQNNYKSLGLAVFAYFRAYTQYLSNNYFYGRNRMNLFNL